jgi:hypothetical protein
MATIRNYSNYQNTNTNFINDSNYEDIWHKIGYINKYQWIKINQVISQLPLVCGTILI